FHPKEQTLYTKEMQKYVNTFNSFQNSSLMQYKCLVIVEAIGKINISIKISINIFRTLHKKSSRQYKPTGTYIIKCTVITYKKINLHKS
ncbi:MAG: hypothetical protein ACOYLO_17285, partial [Ferruginibacter sp.]